MKYGYISIPFDPSYECDWCKCVAVPHMPPAWPVPGTRWRLTSHEWTHSLSTMSSLLGLHITQYQPCSCDPHSQRKLKKSALSSRLLIKSWSSRSKNTYYVVCTLRSQVLETGDVWTRRKMIKFLLIPDKAEEWKLLAQCSSRQNGILGLGQTS